MKIALAFRQEHRRLPVMTYGNSFHQAFLDLGHEVITYGTGHKIPEINNEVRKADLILEIDSGRGPDSKEIYQVPDHPGIKTKKAVYLIDSHGKSDLHQSLAPKYDFVFFAPWIKRDIFASHLSATWLPNATDLTYFGRDSSELKHYHPRFQFGFHGSKLGLGRADKMVELCKVNGWSYDVREVVKGNRHRWPATGIAMRECQNLFNWGQKCDGPNLRTAESLAVGRPLLTDRDPEQRDGMHKLFKEGEHLLYYHRYDFNDLEEKMRHLMESPVEAQAMADRAYAEVKRNHLVINRAQTILEVIGR